MIRTAAFDFDGTLADTVDIVMEGFLRIFDEYLHEKAPSREEIYRHYGMNEAGILRLYLGKCVPEAEAEYYALYAKFLADSPGAFPGCGALLKHLKTRGVTLALITGKARETCLSSLEHLGFSGLFDSMKYGSPDKINKAAQMRELLQEYHLSPEELVYIGDAVSDAEASRKAGIRCFSAAWAPGARREDLMQCNPGMVFDTIESLQKRLDEELPS